jgi:hypothetical protein
MPGVSRLRLSNIIMKKLCIPVYCLSAVSILCLEMLLSPMSDAQVPRKKTDLPKQDRESWREILKIPSECEKSFQATYRSDPTNYGGLEFYPLGRNQYLVAITCCGGAYQPGFIYAYYSESNPSATRLLKLKGFESEDDNDKPLPYSLIDGFDTFNRRTKVLEILSKYRGPGDCGLFVRYKFVGSHPVLLEAREQECDENRIRRSIDYRRWRRKKL